MSCCRDRQNALQEWRRSLVLSISALPVTLASKEMASIEAPTQFKERRNGCLQCHTLHVVMIITNFGIYKSKGIIHREVTNTEQIYYIKCYNDLKLLPLRLNHYMLWYKTFVNFIFV